MKLQFRIVMVLVLSAIATQGQKQAERTQTINIPAYFYKAEEFLQLSEEQRPIYGRGLMDGFYGSALFGGNEKTISYLRACTKDMDSRQLTAIIEQYLKDYPEGRHLPASVEAYDALNAACRQLAR
jgi:hypothetical protein